MDEVGKARGRKFAAQIESAGWVLDAGQEDVTSSGGFWLYSYSIPQGSRLVAQLMWDANKVSSLEIKCHPEQSGSGLVRPLEPPMIAACKAAIREEISKVTIEINDLRFQVRMTLYSHGSGVFRPFEGRCEALG